MNKLWALSISHKEININKLGELIPSFASDHDLFYERLADLKKHFKLNELYFLNTCNRILFIFLKGEEDQEPDHTFVSKFFRYLNPKLHNGSLNIFVESAKIFKNYEVPQHFFKVACSLESLVVGEREILGQLRKAYDLCKKYQLSGDNLRILLQSTVQTAKEVYTHTNIGKNSVSVVSLAVDHLMKSQFSKESRVLFVGAGQSNSLFGKLIFKKGFRNFTVCNRGVENGINLAQALQGNYVPLEKLDQLTDKFDIMICCTGASKAVISKEFLEQIPNNCCIIDLAVPADVASEVDDFKNIQYVSIEDLRALSQSNLARREKEVSFASEIVETRLEEFKVKFRKRNIERAMAEIPVKVRSIKNRALDEVFSKEIDELDDNAKETLEKVIQYFEKKYIGIPISIAKSALENELGMEKRSNLEKEK